MERFLGDIVFLEESLTLNAFQNVISVNQPSTWQVIQSSSYFYEWWPNTMSLEIDPSRDVFILSMTDLESHSVETSAVNPFSKL